MTRRAVPWLVAAVAAAIALLGVSALYRRYVERYTVSRDDQGAAVARVVAVAFQGESALEVARISGTVQATAQDTRGFGLLSSDRVIKAPFSVRYLVDVSHLARRDVRWDAATRTLTLDVPQVTADDPDIDEARATLVATRGLLVTRGASEAMTHKTSVKAEALARAEAARPDFLAAARDHARRDLADLVSAPLAAAGTPPATIRVRFPDEIGTASARSEPLDRSRSLAEVFHDKH